MNAFMNIQVRVLSGPALANLKALEAQSRRTAGAPGMGAINRAAHQGLPYLSKWGNQVQWIGRQLMYNFTLPIGVAAVAATKFALENEKAMVRVEKVYGDASKRFDRLAKTEIPALREAFVALSNQFGVHQAQVIEIAGDWAAAGASGLALAKSVKLTLETMVLGELEAAEATKNLIAIQAQYGQNIVGLSKTIDVLNMVENQTGATMKDLMDAFARSAGVARTAGVDVEHLGAMISALVPASGSASTAGNALKTIISRFLSPTKEAKELLSEMGIAVNEVSWNSLTGTQRLEMMADRFNNLSMAQKAHLSTVLGSRWQLNRLNILMQDIANTNGYYRKSLRATSDDQAIFNQRQEELQKVLQSNPQRIKQAWTMVQNSLAETFTPLLPYISYLVGQLALLADKFANLTPVTQAWVLIGLAFLALLGPIARYVGAVANMLGLLAGFVGWLIPGFMKFGAILAGPFVAASGFAIRGTAGLIGVFWKLFYTVTLVIPAMLGAWKAGLLATLALFNITGKRLIVAWKTAWIAIQVITLQAARAMWLATIAMGSGLLKAHRAIVAGVVAIWGTLRAALPLIAAASFKSLLTVFLTIGRFLLNPWVAAVLVVLGVLYRFKDKLSEIWANIVENIGDAFSGVAEFFSGVTGAIVDAFWALPEGVRDALLAVLRVVQIIALKIYEWLSYLNPFARHSPSLVEQVKKGMDFIAGQYQRAAGFGSAFRKAAADLAAFKKIADTLGLSEWQEEQRDVANGLPRLLKLFKSLRNDLNNLNTIFRQQAAAVAAQERVVDRWDKALDRANARLDTQQTLLDKLQGRLDRLNDQYSKHQQILDELASAPLAGLGAMEDAIFANEQAQNQLRLQILQTGQASREAADAAERAYDRESNALQRLQDALQAVEDQINSHKQAIQELAEMSITGQRAMSDAIFENEMAQKALRLEIMRLEDAGGGVDDIRDRLALLQGDIEMLRGRMADLRSAGAGSEILGPLQDQMDALEAQRRALASGSGGVASAIEEARAELERLEREGQRLQLEESLQFEPLTRQIEQLTNAQQEMDFAAIVAGIRQEQAAIDALTPAYEAANTAVARQQEIVDAAAAARDQAVAAYEREAVAVERLNLELDKLQTRGEILNLEKSLNFDPLERQIRKLAEAQEELSFDEIVAGIERERAAMDRLDIKINEATAAVKAQEAAVKAVEAARDRVSAKHERERQELEVLRDEYQKTVDVIREIESALRDMGSAAASNIQKAAEAARTAKGAGAGGDSVATFNAAAQGDWPDPGSMDKIGRFTKGDETDMIKQFIEETLAETEKTIGNMDIFGPLKRWWSRTWNWIKENVGPIVTEVGAAIRAAFTKSMSGLENSGIIAGFQGVFNKAKTWAGKIWALFLPDFQRIGASIRSAFSSIWNNIAPEVAKFGDLWEPLVEIFNRLWLIVKPLAQLFGGYLLFQIKILASVVSSTLTPVFEMISGVIAGVIRAFRGLLQFIMGVLLMDWKLAWEGIKNIFGGTWDAIVAQVTGVAEVIGGIVSGFVNAIVEFFQWLYDELVGHSIVPDLVDGIVSVFETLASVPQWIWDNVLEPIVDFFVDLWDDVVELLEAWWSGVTKAWDALKGLGDWAWRNILKPVLDAFTNLWTSVKNKLDDWWENIKSAWDALKGLGTWFKNNVLDPVFDKVKELWTSVKDKLDDWWEDIKKTWEDLKGLGGWFWTNVAEPVKDKFIDAWQAIRDSALGWYDRLTTVVFTKLTGIGDWLWKNAWKPIKDTFIDAFNGIKSWFSDNKEKILNPIQSVVRGIVNAINWVIRGINKLSELPGLDFSIGEINLPDFFASGGSLPSRKVGNGFITRGARAIVGEGKANYPEYVIPTDPTYRSRAQALLQQAAGKVGMLGIPMHEDGGILGKIGGGLKDIIGGAIDAGKGGLDWLVDGAKQIASKLAMPLINRAKEMIDGIDWTYGRQALRVIVDKVVGWVFDIDKIFEEKAADFSAPGGPPVQAGDWERMSWRGHTFNARTVRMIQAAEAILGQVFTITQGSWSTSVAASGSTHAGGGVFDSTFPNTTKAEAALRQVGFAAWIRNPSQGPWPYHIHAVALGDVTASDSAKAQMQSYLAGGDGLAKGGIVRARVGGVMARMAEAGRDEAVIPLPRGWRTDIAGRSQSGSEGDTVINIYGNLEFPNIDTAEDAEVFIANLKSLAGGAA